MQTRIYRVDEKDSSGNIYASFLVRAPNVQQAIRHCAKRFGAEVATQDDLVQLTEKGVAVQNANGSGIEVEESDS